MGCDEMFYCPLRRDEGHILGNMVCNNQVKYEPLLCL